MQPTHPDRTSELQAYVMQFNRMTQMQARAWLDKWLPDWDKPHTEPRKNIVADLL